jgi:hypothetical protein
MISLLSYSENWIAIEELLLSTLDIAMITFMWATFCLNDDGNGVWSLPRVARSVRSEIESEKHLAKQLIM